jgi:hypothetical protein
LSFNFLHLSSFFLLRHNTLDTILKPTKQKQAGSPKLQSGLGKDILKQRTLLETPKKKTSTAAKPPPATAMDMGDDDDDDDE